MADSDDSADDADDQAAALNNIVQPLRKQIKKQAHKIEKLQGLVKQLEEERSAESRKREALERQLSEVSAGSDRLRSTIDANPWRPDAERLREELRVAEKRTADALDEQRVQMAAHAQAFQATQTTVATLSQEQSNLHAGQTDTSRRAADELRALTARLDHMRGEMTERVQHTFSESTGHADRLNQRVQEELQRLDQELAQRAQAKLVGDAAAATQAELHELRAANDELRRELRGVGSQLAELREAQVGCALKTAVSAGAAATEQRLSTLEDSLRRVEAAVRETTGAVNGGRFGQRCDMIEARQMRLERETKTAEMRVHGMEEALAARPLKTDVISAIAQQELLVEACASREAVERLEQRVEACAAAAAVGKLEERVRVSHEQLTKTSAALVDLRDSAATRESVSQRGKEIDALGARLEEKLGRDEGAALLASKLDKAEAKGLMQQQESLQALVNTAQTHAQRCLDAQSNTSNTQLDSMSGVKALTAKVERLSAVTQELDGKLGARRNEMASLTKVLRLLLDDAEMRCAIDESEGANAAEATDVFSRMKGAGAPRHGGGGGAPMTVSGVTLHRAAAGGGGGGSGPLQPMPPGAAAADKVWYKSTLSPRGDLLGARRRMLINARHSWVGDTCLARADLSEPGSGGGGGGGGASGVGASGGGLTSLRTPHPPGAAVGAIDIGSGSGGAPHHSGSPCGGVECMLTPSSTGPEPPA